MSSAGVDPPNTNATIATTSTNSLLWPPLANQSDNFSNSAAQFLMNHPLAASIFGNPALLQADQKSLFNTPVTSSQQPFHQLLANNKISPFMQSPMSNPMQIPTDKMGEGQSVGNSMGTPDFMSPVGSPPSLPASCSATIPLSHGMHMNPDHSSLTSAEERVQSNSTQSFNSESWMDDSPRNENMPKLTKAKDGTDGTSPSSQHDDDNSSICNVCGDEASGRHYGAATCFGCKGFFRRTVRANKTYNCRYEERCEIDKVGRNICRACRFRKCLDVGMEPDAIRPDRDKTGKQKNPRHSEEKDLKSEDSADASTSAERDLILQTLLEIERICLQLKDLKTEKDFDQTSEEHQPDHSLIDALHQPSVIYPRTEINYNGNQPVLSHTEFQEGFSRLITLCIDYSNTLKPIADLEPNEKIKLIQSYISSFMVFSTAFRSVSSDRDDSILLPNGTFVGSGANLGSFIDLRGCADKFEAHMLNERTNLICSQVVNTLQHSMRQLEITEVEYVTLKAIIALDPSASGISAETSSILGGARDSVQNALFLHLMDRYSSQRAIARYGRLLMLTANVAKIGAFLSTAVESVSSLYSAKLSTAPLIFRFFNLSEAKSVTFLELHGRPISTNTILCCVALMWVIISLWTMPNVFVFEVKKGQCLNSQIVQIRWIVYAFFDTLVFRLGALVVSVVLFCRIMGQLKFLAGIFPEISDQILKHRKKIIVLAFLLAILFFICSLERPLKLFFRLVLKANLPYWTLLLENSRNVLRSADEIFVAIKMSSAMSFCFL
ncbi:zinc finger, c4 type (two domains) domain-containing protein [Ditylenchus destructor]|uniref:Zinc finger, c4 type (Two domains) domain-containing protein n=1 Tax=Ditylenchus destructor TaxID=166010 RepID=A0AAD4N300_9BILA|nr:zinc finger, c4 type (two domains) domain-containing protein [Ditylenchus destructor]